ncbi:MAG: 4-hydroxythreonine-4-phosphate dehydrogenase PdxA [Candidatus Eisenbacteria bacterium]
MRRTPRGQPRLALSVSDAHDGSGGDSGPVGSGSASAPGGAGGPDRRPRLVLTMGDPAGVGPEVALRVLADASVAPDCDLSIAGDPAALEEWAGRLSLPLARDVVDVGIPSGNVVPGRPTDTGARSALASIETAARLCMCGEADAIVTAPVSKAAIAATGTDFSGHTEFLAKLTGAVGFVMTFVHGASRVALATTHLPLAEVPATLTPDLLLQKLEILSDGLESWLGVRSPKIAVTALNPHAGEAGRFGDEEERIIAPAIARAREAGIDATGPHSADSIFVGHGDRGASGPGSVYDAILAMYHDQGTIAAKLMGFGHCVNLTLGLPIVRTSADHGTAFEIAGRGLANHESMAAAARLAAAVARRRSESP